MQDKLKTATHALSNGTQAMLPEASSCTPRSQDVSVDAGSSSDPASQGPCQWDAVMPRDFK
eukprot:3052334-Prorocentrum_lima.AAC.1